LGGLFTRGGTSSRDALKLLTSNPARMLGVDDRVGTLVAGHDADFVVLSSDPFKAGSTVLATWIDGSSAFDRKTADRMTIVQASAVYTPDGVQQNASVVVSGKTIRGVGTNVSAPGDARTKRFPNGVIVPGFIDLSTGLGLGGPVSTTSVSTKLGERLTADDESAKYARQGGVTTALLSTSGKVSPVLAFKLGQTPRTLRDPVGIKFAISSNLTTGIPSLKRTLTSAKTYHEKWLKYEADMVEYKQKLKEYETARAKYDAAKKVADAKQKAAAAKKAADAKKATDAAKTPTTKKEPEEKPADKKVEKPADSKDKPEAKTDDKKTAQNPATKKPAEKKAEAKPDPNAPKKPTEPKKPSTSSTYQPYRALFAGKIPAFVEADTMLKLKAAVKLFREEFKLRTIVVGANDLYRVADLLAKNDVSVSVGPALVREVENETHNLPQILANHQIPFGFQSKATTGVRQLPWAIQYAVHKGLGTADALAGLTQQPAQLLSLDDQIGSLAVGKDADLVVLSGPPFEISSEVLAVMIDGVWVYEKETE
jgi:imidazolonepropionase-like amidohydrolase